MVRSRRMLLVFIAGFVAVSGVIAGTVPPAAACTCFSIRQADAVYVGRNYDWDFSDALVLVNKRDMEKSAAQDSTRQPFRWVSRYGSVTFNQYGREFPTGGINEAGLVVEVLWLGGTVFPPEDDRMALGSIHWIQYQLDTAATVGDVVASLEKVRVSGSIEIHFFVADRTGATAAIEFLDGKPVVHRSDAGDNAAAGLPMPVQVLTNHTYEASVSFLKSCKGWGGSDTLPATSPRSLPRFGRAATGVRGLETLNRLIDTADVFDVLKQVTHEGTQWSIVYDLTRLAIEFRTHASPAHKSIRLSDLDFSCSTPVSMLDIDRKQGGDVSAAWLAYTRDANRDLIGRSYGKTEFLKQVPKESLDGLAGYPETARCLSPATE
jgi:penicillin V acylase-like amidase (Ntn superfamily)